MSTNKTKSNDEVTSKTMVLAKKLLEESTIDNNVENKKFLNKRNIALIVVFSIVAAAAIVLTFVFVLNIDFKLLFSAMGQGFAHKIGGLWFSLLFLGIFFSIFYNWVPIAIRMRKMGYKISFRDWVVLGFICTFIRFLTPLNLVSDPFTIYWLTLKGVPVSKATGILFTNTFLWELVQIVIKLPSFILCMLNVGELTKTASGITVLVFMCVGFAIDYIGLAVMTILCVSKSAHYRISVIFNWFRRKFHMKYSTKEEIKEKYKVRAEMKKDFLLYMKDAKTTIFVILSFAFFELYTYLMVNFGMSFTQYYSSSQTNITYYLGFDYGVIYNCSSMATTANKINFIPNGELGIEWILNTLIDSYKGLGWSTPIPEWQETSITLAEVQTSIVHNGIFLSRLFWAFFPALLGMFVTVPVCSIYINKRRKANKLIKKLA